MARSRSEVAEVEAAHIAEMTRILRRKMARDHAQGRTLRDAHPKTTGLLRARFEIDDNLPIELRVGVFAEPRTFDCWVRTSNASGKPQADSVPDARGLAIKLMTAKDRTGIEHGFGQDFVLLSSPTMPLGTVALFRDAVRYAVELSPVLLAAKLLFTLRPGVLLALAALRIRPSSPLDIRYWSTTPYRFGRNEAVKYSLLPTSAHTSTLPDAPRDDYLADAMQAHLELHEATFDFCVQFQAEGMPIEDAGPRWDEAVSPFRKVATLRIPKQAFRTDKRAALAEALAFSPAHALPAHAPLGGINRARAKIYADLAAFRHERDGRKPIA